MLVLVLAGRYDSAIGLGPERFTRDLTGFLTAPPGRHAAS